MNKIPLLASGCKPTKQIDGVSLPNLRLWPCTIAAAQRHVQLWHRHLPNIQGGLFATSVVDPVGAVVGVAIAANPPREWQGTGRFVIARVATPGIENACSMLYGSLCRAAKALGYQEAWTYTLPEEPGTSLRAAGFTDEGLTSGGEWNTPARARRSAIKGGPKRRWRRTL